ncbi:MAG TPA: DUF2029 domain-containing protein [Candidatus Luteococcus avicola]|nr:DUF2029 domain-containing protein [Candidatus Luteococcus avicola]
MGLLLMARVVRTLVSNMIGLGVPWDTKQPHTLLDFRDLIIVPGRFLWNGGNPYDNDSYLAINPWAQEFDPYAPTWLLISGALGWMPPKVAAAIYLLLGNGAVAGMCRLLSGWVTRSQIWLLAGLFFCYAQLWYPTRTISSSLLVTVGVAICFAELWRREPRWHDGAGLAIALVKPQFGVPLLVFMALARQWRMVWRSVVWVLATSLAPLVACVVASGGPVGFVRDIFEVAAHAASAQAPTGLASPENFRTDLQGLAYRFSPALGTPALIAAVIVFGLVCLLWLRSDKQARIAPAVLLSTIALLPIHISYDWVIFVVSAAAAAAWCRACPARERLVGAAVVITPILNQYRIPSLFGIQRREADLIAMLWVLLVLVLGSIMLLRDRPAVAPRLGKGFAPSGIKL